MGEGLPSRAHDEAGARVVVSDGGVDGGGKDVGPHDHARATAGGGIVDGVVPVGGVVADVAGLE